MGFFGPGKKTRIQELEEQLAIQRQQLAAAHQALEASNTLLTAERAKTSALLARIGTLKANAVEALTADAERLLHGLSVASNSVQAIRDSVDVLLEAKGNLAQVRERCSTYTAKLTAADAEIAVATVAYRQWRQLLQDVQHSPTVPEVHSSAALAAITEIHILIEAMKDEEEKMKLDARRMERSKREFAQFQAMKEKLAELERRDRDRGPRNPKSAAAAVPHPNGHSHIIPKGIAGNKSVPPSMR